MEIVEGWSCARNTMVALPIWLSPPCVVLVWGLGFRYPFAHTSNYVVTSITILVKGK